MDDESGLLVPSADRAIFLLTVPPKSFRNHEHRCVQVQRVVQESDQNEGLRIKPVFNLEYHRLFPVRIIELEHDDAKIAEFYPTRSTREDRDSVHLVAPKIVRPRAFSLDNRTGGSGGKIVISKAFRGLAEDITVIGSEIDGIFKFESISGPTIIWRKSKTGSNVEWTLQTPDANEISDAILTVMPQQLPAIQQPSNEDPELNMPYATQARRSGPPALRRAKTNFTMASQYTTAFANESQLSGLTSSPQLSDCDLARVSQGEELTVLCSYPVPHLSLSLRHLESLASPRGSISGHEHQLDKLLLCILWLTWCSPDLLCDPDQYRVTEGDGTLVTDQELQSVDQNIRTEINRPTERRESRLPSIGTSKSDDTKHERKRPGIMKRIARICG